MCRHVSAIATHRYVQRATRGCKAAVAGGVVVRPMCRPCHAMAVPYSAIVAIPGNRGTGHIPGMTHLVMCSSAHLVMCSSA